MRSEAEFNSIKSLIRTLTARQASSFSIRLNGAPPGKQFRVLLSQQYPELQAILECFVSSAHIEWRYDPAQDATTVNYTQVSYTPDKSAELILNVKGWAGFHKAFALVRMARCANAAIIVDFSPEELANATERPTKYLLDRMPEEMDRSEKLYGDPLEYSQRRRSNAGSVWNSTYAPNRYVFFLNQYQFESFGIRIGLQTEICKLNHSLFAGHNYTDREKVLVVDRWIRDNIEYLDEDNTADHSAAVTLLRRKGVCQGFASLVIAMLQLENIPALYIRGCFTEESAHAWNLVRLDGQWLHLDCTWGRHYNGADHPYLLRTDETFPKHTWDHEEYSHRMNEIKAASIERLNRHNFTFRLNDFRYTVDDATVHCPNRNPMIQWGQQKMIDMVSLFSFMKLGYQQHGQQLCIYTRDRFYAFPVAQDGSRAPCQILMHDNNLYISAHALAQLPGVYVTESADSLTVQVR